MSWQDIVIAVCCFVFGFGLFPAVRSATQKPPRSTALITAIAQTVLAITLATLSLWLGTAGNGLCALLWWILVFQKRQESVEEMLERAAASPPIDFKDPKQMKRWKEDAANFIMGGDDVPDCFLDAQELEARRKKQAGKQ